MRRCFIKADPRPPSHLGFTTRDGETKDGAEYLPSAVERIHPNVSRIPAPSLKILSVSVGTPPERFLAAAATPHGRISMLRSLGPPPVPRGVLLRKKWDEESRPSRSISSKGSVCQCGRAEDEYPKSATNRPSVSKDMSERRMAAEADIGLPSGRETWI